MVQSTKSQKVTKGHRLEPHAGEVCAYVLVGETDAQIAEWFGTSRESVTRFRDRHRDDIAAMREEVARQVSDFAIAHQVNRIAGLQALADQVQAVIDERGLIERTITTTEHSEIVRERFARELPAELRAIYKDAATELDQLPNGTTVNIDQRKVIIRSYDGWPEKLS